LFAAEAADGLLLGLCAGYLVYLMLRRIDHLGTCTDSVVVAHRNNAHVQ
jgi:NhaP-type Na+/H+ or K+/H+ antiporter